MLSPDWNNTRKDVDWKMSPGFSDWKFNIFPMSPSTLTKHFTLTVCFGDPRPHCFLFFFLFCRGELSGGRVLGFEFRAQTLHCLSYSAIPFLLR
jgi:hypothetical protein